MAACTYSGSGECCPLGFDRQPHVGCGDPRIRALEHPAGSCASQPEPMRGGRRPKRKHVHSAQFTDGEVTTIDGLAVTTPARTVVDLACSLPFEQALVAGNSALHRPAVRIDDILARAPRHSLHRHTFHAVSAVDARIESDVESRSLALFVRERLPIPQPQGTTRQCRSGRSAA